MLQKNNTVCLDNPALLLCKFYHTNKDKCKVLKANAQHRFDSFR